MIQYLETCSPIFHSVSCWRSQAGTFLKKKKKTKDEIIQKGKMGSLYWRKLGWVGWVGGGWSLKFKRGLAFIWHITNLNSEFIFSQVQKRCGAYLTYHQSLNSEFIISSSKEAWRLSDISPVWTVNLLSLTFKRGMVLSDTSPESKQWIYYLSSSKEEWCYLINHQSLNSEFIISLLLKRYNAFTWHITRVWLVEFLDWLSGTYFVNAAYTYTFSLQSILPSLFFILAEARPTALPHLCWVK